MHPDILLLAERLVVAIESMSQDVKNISSYVYDLNYNVSNFLIERREKDEGNSFPFGASSGGQERPPEREYSGNSEQPGGGSLSHIESMENEKTSVGDIATMSMDHNESSDTVSSFIEQIKTEILSEGEEDALCVVNNISDDDDNNDYDRNNVIDFAGGVKIVISVDCHPWHEEGGISSAIAVLKDKDCTTLITSLQGGNISVINTHRNESALSSNDCMVGFLRKSVKGNEGISSQYLSHCGIPPQENCKESVPTSKEVVGEEDEEQIEDKWSESHFTANEEKEREGPCAPSRKARFEQSGRQKKTKESFHCNICSKFFSTLQNLKNHRRMHREFRCAVCNKPRSSLRDLMVHMRVHTNERPYKCSVCEKAFKCRTNLATHMRLHSGEKPFQCTECGKAFTQSSNLVVHMRSHTGEKPFRCDECGMDFARSDFLKQHMRVHTGVCQFACENCGSRFNRPVSLRRHMLLSHGVHYTVS